MKKVLVAMALALAIPATALAARPQADAWYDQTKDDGTVLVAKLHVSKDGKKVDEFTAYGKCNPVPFAKPISMKITKAGTFALNGKRKDVLNKAHQVVIKGKFTSPREATGFYNIGAKGCKGKKVKFAVVLSAQQG